MDELDPVLRAALGALRRPVAEDPSARRRLDEALRRARAGTHPTSSAHRLRRPRRITLSPAAAALSAALLLSAGLAGGVWIGAGDAPPPVATPTASSPRPVSFLFVSPEARSVVVVGDFNGWDATVTPLVRTGPEGTWSATIPLPPGRYTYSYLVDGTEWRPDPIAPPAPGETFGRPSSVLFVEAES